MDDGCCKYGNAKWMQAGNKLTLIELNKSDMKASDISLENIRHQNIRHQK